MTSESQFKRKLRVRASLKRKSRARVRLSVFRSNNHIYAQIVNDEIGTTLAAASTKDKELASLKSKSNVDAAREVGKLVAARAKKANVTEVVFDRGAYMYHGRVRALAEGAREAGLEF